MRSWSKVFPLGDAPQKHEVWIDNLTAKKYPVTVTYGKEVKIFDLKVHEVEDYAAVVRRVRSKCRKIFSGRDLKKIMQCLVCGKKTDDKNKVFEVYGAVYVTCGNCSHVYLQKFVDENALSGYYTKSKSYQKTYAEVRNSKVRVEGVAKPKARWSIEQYKHVFGRQPKSILDVGAGSGHFIKACRDLGLKADGIELSETGRKFSKDFFNIELKSADFIKEWKKFTGYDIVTFWGVVEHVWQPTKLLSSARQALSEKNGLVIAAVPHWNSFSTAVQGIFSKSIVRHLDPSSHVSCFTDASIATAFVKAGLDISAAWYFGMDAYEFITQSSYFLRNKQSFSTNKHSFSTNKQSFSSNKALIEFLRPSVNRLQYSIDCAMLSDEIALAGKVTR